MQRGKARHDAKPPLNPKPPLDSPASRPPTGIAMLATLVWWTFRCRAPVNSESLGLEIIRRVRVLQLGSRSENVAAPGPGCLQPARAQKRQGTLNFAPAVKKQRPAPAAAPGETASAAFDLTDFRVKSSQTP